MLDHARSEGKEEERLWREMIPEISAIQERKERIYGVAEDVWTAVMDSAGRYLSAGGSLSHVVPSSNGNGCTMFPVSRRRGPAAVSAHARAEGSLVRVCEFVSTHQASPSSLSAPGRPRRPILRAMWHSHETTTNAGVWRAAVGMESGSDAKDGFCHRSSWRRGEDEADRLV